MEIALPATEIGASASQRRSAAVREELLLGLAPADLEFAASSHWRHAECSSKRTTRMFNRRTTHQQHQLGCACTT